MAKTIKGFLIDPYTETITEVSLTKSDRSFLNEMYKLLDCDTVTSANFIDETHDLWTDDEGLLREIPDKKFTFCDLTYQGVFAGKCLILRTTESGDCADATIPLSELKKSVKYLNAGDARQIAGERERRWMEELR